MFFNYLAKTQSIRDVLLGRDAKIVQQIINEHIAEEENLNKIEKKNNE